MGSHQIRSKFRGQCDKRGHYFRLECHYIFQLTHSGEISNPDFSKRVTPNPLPGYGGELLTEADVEKIMDSYVTAAKIAYKAGADGIDMKLCHGYLGSQMIRPHNDRDWKYGGSWENRSRFAFKLIERIREAVPDEKFLIGSKVSAWEGFPGGFGTEGPHSPIMDLTPTGGAFSRGSSKWKKWTGFLWGSASLLR